MNNKFEITKEQLDSLVSMSEYPDAATIIAIAVMKTPAPPPEPKLPHNPAHDGYGTSGLKRIYHWIGWEMAYENYRIGGRMNSIQNSIADEILRREPDANFEYTDEW